MVLEWLTSSGPNVKEGSQHEIRITLQIHLTDEDDKVNAEYLNSVEK